MGKKKGNKQAWLDWLADDPPAPDAQAELRERFKQQANSYRPVNRSLQGHPPVQQPVAQPVPPQPSVAAPQAPVQPQAVSQTPPAPKPVPASPEASQGSVPATVSIQIHFPSLKNGPLGKLFASIKQGSGVTKTWVRHQFANHRRRSLTIAIGVPLLLVLLIVPPLFIFGKNPMSESGGTSGSSAGATAKYEKPTFDVVTPSTKTKLATPDGVHAAYDGEKNVYTYSDGIGGNGFTVSQQPIPPQFSDGTTAVETIAPTLYKGVTPVKLNVITGTAYVSTNPKYNSQALVLNVRDVLVFIQSSHAFKDSEWVSYINTLQ
jgi:hypothetical protein